MKLKVFVASILFVGSALLASQVPAGAHVRVTPNQAEAGSTVDFVFTVPNESETANTTQLQVYFPEGYFPSTVAVDPKPGWTITVDNSTGKVGSIQWAGGSIPPHGRETFAATVTLPKDTPTLKLPVVQTYSDGFVQRWIEDPKADGSESEHPAPIVTLTGAVAATTTTSTTAVSATTTPNNADSKQDDEGKGLPLGVSLIVIGVAIGVIVYIRIRKNRAGN